MYFVRFLFDMSFNDCFKAVGQPITVGSKQYCFKTA